MPRRMKFQSSPAPKSRCYDASLREFAPQALVSILTGSEEPVLPHRYASITMSKTFQSSPAPKSRCYPGCGGRGDRRRGSFNPHRLRRAGATPRRGGGRPFGSWFQSSPAPKSRCYAGSPLRHRVGTVVSILTGSEEPVLPARAPQRTYRARFQSSPAPKSRCYSDGRRARLMSQVSILTGSEEPVLHGLGEQPGHGAGVSILTGSEEPVLPAMGRHCCRDECRFNPHRLRRAGATQPRFGIHA